jgi:predicted NBD/HSP70 family sugar kinase
MASPRTTSVHLTAQGGATEQLRRANLSRVLGLVHRDGAQSRAELTRNTGLNRSTVGALVAELTELGLVTEALPTEGNLPGRPSPIVTAAPEIAAIAVNPEVDAIHVGLVGLGGHIIARVRLDLAHIPTSSDVVALSSAAISGLLSGRPALRIVGVGIAVPGQVRLSDGEVRDATHMDWVDEPLGRLIAEATGMRTWAANAAYLGMRAESVFGTARGVDDFVYFIGGASGIGGGAVMGGQLLTGSAGYAGEFGHTFVRSHGTPCSCGASGCLEAELTQSSLLDAVGLAPADADQLATRLGESTDPVVRALLEAHLELLGIAVRTTVNSLNPSLVVLSGFLAALFDAGGPGTQERLVAGAIRSARDTVRIESAPFGSNQLMIGAGELVFADLLADPANFLAESPLIVVDNNFVA